MLLAVEAVPESDAVIATATKLVRRSQAEVLVLSIRERDFARGFVWDVRQPGDIAETVSRAVYELRRAGVNASGMIRIARSGRVADEIVYTARKYHADGIVIGSSTRSWLGRLFFGSVGPRVLRISDLPVIAVPTRRPRERAVTAFVQRSTAGPNR